MTPALLANKHHLQVGCGLRLGDSDLLIGNGEVARQVHEGSAVTALEVEASLHLLQDFLGVRRTRVHCNQQVVNVHVDHHPYGSVVVEPVQALLQDTFNNTKLVHRLLQVEVPLPARILGTVDGSRGDNDVAGLVSRRRRVGHP